MTRGKNQAWWLLFVPLLAGNCSSHDVKLGEDLPKPMPDPGPPPDPEPEPEPILDPDPPSPEPLPTPTQPCEVNEPDADCEPTLERCQGRVLSGAGFECAAGGVCCLDLVTAPPPGGASGLEPPLAGVGGQ